MSHVYCPECGFQNPGASNYCSKCGALLVPDDEHADTTVSLTPEEVEEEGVLSLEGLEGPALVVRTGGGRAGEHFTPTSDVTSIGRSPDCDIFLDDVTVSRRHAVLTEKGGEFTIEDQGSLNGTFLNRHRIDAAESLEDGDEIQVGKYRLIFLSR